MPTIDMSSCECCEYSWSFSSSLSSSSFSSSSSPSSSHSSLSSLSSSLSSSVSESSRSSSESSGGSSASSSPSESQSWSSSLTHAGCEGNCAWRWVTHDFVPPFTYDWELENDYCYLPVWAPPDWQCVCYAPETEGTYPNELRETRCYDAPGQTL